MIFSLFHAAQTQEKKIMIRPTVPVLAFAVLATVAAPAAAQTDISGVWEFTIEAPQGAATIDATFQQSGEAVTGKVDSPMGSAEFTGTLVKDALNIGYSIEVQGTKLDITMAGKLAGDTMAGTIAFGGMGEAAWSAKRKPAATPTAAAAQSPAAPATAAAAATGGVAGKWNIALQTPQGEFPLTATLTQDGEKVAGTLSSQIGEMPVNGTLKGSALNLEFVAVTPNGDITITMTGNVEGAGLTGKANFGGMGEADWKGTRVE
jgi:hypothetical protein